MLNWPWDQIGILVFGLPAMWLITYRQFHIRRWGYIAGLLSEIFWVWTCIVHDQLLILASVAVYTLFWGRGAWEHWLRKEPKL